MGLFTKECSYCGSKEHASKDCPHGIFSSTCDYCGSTEHATKNCPHGIFSSKCDYCGSIEHATKNCPHGIFSSKCDYCGSTEHATKNCPHGIFSSKCDYCGSVNHATDDCPHGLFASPSKIAKKTYSSVQSMSTNDEGSCLIKFVAIIIVGAIIVWFVFAVAVPLIIINTAFIALIAGFVKTNWTKYLFPIAIFGGIMIVLDYNLGWLTSGLIETISLSRGSLKVFLYINLIAGFIAAYFTIRNLFDANNPNPDNDEFSKRNIIIMSSLFLGGALTIGGQNYFDNKKTLIPLNAEIADFTNSTLQEKNNNQNSVREFSGNVGKLDAIYNLTWNSDGSIEGYYKYPKRPNMIYTLKGRDLGNGEISLTEYTDDVITANCILKLQADCYVGTMNNIDGRILKMNMCLNNSNNTSENEIISIPVKNLFKAWETLNLNLYMEQWDKNAKQFSKKFDTRNYEDIFSSRQSLFERLNSVNIVYFKILEVQWKNENRVSLNAVYSMEFNFKNGKKIMESDIIEKYLLEYKSNENRWVILENYDYID